MSYELRYHTNLCKNLQSSKSRVKPVVVFKWLFLSVLLVLSICLPEEGFWKEFLIPGDTNVTIQAVETFSENLKGGASVEEAFHEFCLELVNFE